jgi:hypothetical protein
MQMDQWKKSCLTEGLGFEKYSLIYSFHKSKSYYKSVPKKSQVLFEYIVLSNRNLAFPSYLSKNYRKFFPLPLFEKGSKFVFGERFGWKIK